MRRDVAKQFGAGVLALMSVVMVAVMMGGCAGAPTQKAQQTVAPDSAAAAKLDQVQAQVLSLTQSNQQIVQAIQKSAQDADQFRTEVKGSVASLTQNQFRLESWWAEVSARYRARLLGFGGFRMVDDDQAAAGLAGKPGVPGVRVALGDVRVHDSQVIRDWRPSVFELLIAFILGGVAVSCLMAFDPSLAAKVSTGEHGILAVIESAWNTVVGFVEGIFGIKRKAATPKPGT